MRSAKNAMVILVPALLFAVSAPAWSADSDQAVPSSAQPTTAYSYASSLLTMVGSVVTSEPNQRQAQGNCKSPQLYSQHDVVGEPEACFQGHYGVGAGSTFVPVTAP